MSPDQTALHGVTFLPWVGERYGVDSRFGRLLVLGESHYGAGEPKATFTKEVVEECTQMARTGTGQRHRFFTIVANILRGEAGWIDDRELSDIYREIAFYNFVQSFVGEGPRGEPTFRQWVDAQAPLNAVLGELRPNAVLVLGYRLKEHILALPPTMPHEVIAHPASSDLRYDEAIPKVEKLIDWAKTA